MNKFRKQLKRCGMEEEFKNWMTKKTWSVGSRIALTENLSSMGFSKGDLGTIVETPVCGGTKGVDVTFDLRPKEKYYLWTERMRLI